MKAVIFERNVFVLVSFGIIELILSSDFDFSFFCVRIADDSDFDGFGRTGGGGGFFVASLFLKEAREKKAHAGLNNFTKH